MSEIGEVGGIKLKGGNFKEVTSLNLLSTNEKEPLRLSLIYGENGSGKTTISRAFSKIKYSEEGTEDSQLINTNGETINIEKEKSNIFVFNENFINRNVRVEQSGLNSIVILGDQNNVDKEIEEIKKGEEAELNQKLSEAEQLEQEFNDEKNNKSPKYYINNMSDSLKGNENWAGRKRFIYNKKSNSPVSPTTYKSFINLKPDSSRDKLVVKYSELKTRLQDIRFSGKRLTIQIIDPNKEFSNLLSEFERAKKLLSTIIEKPNLNSRDLSIIRAIKEVSADSNLDKTKRYFSNPEVSYCPFCFQKVTKNYKDELLSEIKKYLRKEAEEHKNDLKQCIMNPLKIDFASVEKIKEIDLTDVKQYEERLNNEIKIINDKIQNKINDPYQPLEINNGFSENLDNLRQVIQKLNKKINEYNSKVLDTKEIIKKLDQVNNQIAYFDIIDDYKLYVEAVKNQKEFIEEFKLLTEQKKNIQDKLSELEEKKKNVNIALNSINDDLKYIFFSDDRLSLRYSNGKYILYSHGDCVQPNQVSVGERNIIALCYFFISILSGKEENEFNEPYLIVIDDPVSSFDKENKVGIISYLKYKIGEFIGGNKDTKIVILTHDLQTLYDLQKITNDFPKEIKKLSKTFYLIDKKVKIGNTINEYSEMMYDVYMFAKGSSNTNLVTIGNEMRRMLEAYGTFNYRIGINEFTSDEILESLSNEKEKKYFKNLMYRLVLNGESHTEERIETAEDLNFFDYISSGEKKRTAQDILCLLYKLDKEHVIRHLNNGHKISINEIEETLGHWCNNIN